MWKTKLMSLTTTTPRFKRNRFRRPKGQSSLLQRRRNRRLGGLVDERDDGFDLSRVPKCAVGLISCGKLKCDHPCWAKGMYMGLYYLKQRAFIEAFCDEWWIISAKHGLLHPDTQIEPYDVTLGEMTSFTRRLWARSVRVQILKAVSSNQILLSTMGNNYSECLTRLPHDIRSPFTDEGGMGMRIQTLGMMVEAKERS